MGWNESTVIANVRWQRHFFATSSNFPPAVLFISERTIACDGNAKQWSVLGSLKSKENREMKKLLTLLFAIAMTLSIAAVAQDAGTAAPSDTTKVTKAEKKAAKKAAKKNKKAAKKAKKEAAKNNTSN